MLGMRREKSRRKRSTNCRNAGIAATVAVVVVVVVAAAVVVGDDVVVVGADVDVVVGVVDFGVEEDAAAVAAVVAMVAVATVVVGDGDACWLWVRVSSYAGRDGRCGRSIGRRLGT